MTVHLVNQSKDQPSVELLDQIYQSKLVTPEKKPFVVDLKKSFGPYLAVAGKDEFILDGCSQIATLSLGFNASPLFAPCHHLESWTGNYQTENILAVAQSYRNLLKRLLGETGDQYHVHFCSSGAEAVEISLGICYERRANPSANKVLAFEGSFHGRMMVALSATWNPKKREPFAWPGFESVFAPYPFIHGDGDFQERERFALESVKNHLSSGNFFAVLIEPMQCEGGDRYSSPEFHNQLIALARSFEVPIVYDEVQTGFHLGSNFFWHTQFGLNNENAVSAGPDVIACAKKSQVGVVISKHDIPFRESFCPASLIRGYACASIIDQFDDQIAETESLIQEQLNQLVEKHNQRISNPRSQGLAFAFDFSNGETLNQFVSQRFHHGLLFYSAGNCTARFRLNLMFGDEDVETLFQQIDRCLVNKEQNPPPQELEFKSNKSKFKLHSSLVNAKLQSMENKKPPADSTILYLEEELTTLGHENFKVVMLDTNNYPVFRDRILAMQEEVYEPARQSPSEEFDLIFEPENSIQPPAILILNDDRIVAMAFAGPIKNFAQERGVADDPMFGDDNTFYILDLTIAKEYRGGLGAIMKNSIAMLGMERGIHAIHGRNRDRLARSMWAINVALGAYETKHLEDDYPDQNVHRDCIYYRLPLRWEPSRHDDDLPFLNLDMERIGPEFIERNMPSLVNKICLSNFVTRELLDDLCAVAQALPKSLRRIYTASSLSESVDKITKAIWLKRKPHYNLLTVEGHYFGEGSFLSRSLSGVGDPFFPVTRIKHYGVVDQLEEQLSSEKWIAFYVQTEQFEGQEEILAECVELCRQYQTPIVYNESGLRFGSKDQFSRKSDLSPDAGVAWLGGQMALSYTTDDFFADDPLLLISTWDGDAYALARFAETMRQQND